MEAGDETPAGPPQQTELFVNGQSAGTFDGDELTAKLHSLFPDSIISLTNLRVWDPRSGALDANPNVKLDQLLVWDNSTSAVEKAPGQSQAAGKVGKARDLANPRVLTWRGASARRRLHAAFVRKDAQS
jgi:hypothetical protein